MAENVFVTVQNLTKAYGRRKAVDDVSFTASCGSLVGVLGENGAGKSTLLAMLAGSLAPDSGMVSVGNQDLDTDALAYRRAVGYLPAPPPLYADMTVGAYLRFVYDLKGVRAINREEHIAQAAVSAGAEALMKRLIGHLSGGLKQRVGLAAALLGDPDVLLLDEPTTGLDPRQLSEARVLFAEQGKSRVVLLSSHILSEVSAVCGRVLMLHEGRLVYDGPVLGENELRERFLAVTN